MPMNNNAMMMAFFAMRNKSVTKSERNRALILGSMSPPSAASLVGILAGQKAVEATARVNAEAIRFAAVKDLGVAASTLDALVNTGTVGIGDQNVIDFTNEFVATWGRR